MMDFTNIPYYIKSGIRNALNNKAMSLSAIIVVAVGMSILGIYLSISGNVDYMSNELYSRYTLSAYIEKGTPQQRLDEIAAELGEIDGVKETRIISEEEALEECREMFADSSSFLDGLEGENNPLRASVEIKLKDISRFEETAKEAERVTDVVWVKSSKDIAEKLISSTAMVKRVSLVLMLIFFAAALFVITNTIKITILARSRDIYTMRYLGALNRFIVSPFVVEGVFISLIGSIAAVITVTAGYTAVYGYINNMLGEMNRLMSAAELVPSIALKLIITGAAVGAASSATALIRYMKA